MPPQKENGVTRCVLIDHTFFSAQINKSIRIYNSIQNTSEFNIKVNVIENIN